MTQTIARASLIVGGLLLPLTVIAQAPIERPTLKLGDVWEFRTTDLWNNQTLRTTVAELVAVQAERYVFRNISSTAPEPTTSVFTKDLQPCRSMQGSTKEVCTGGLRFPLKVGDRTSYSELPWQTGEGYDSGNCEVKAAEDVTVAAGTYATLRIECSGTWTRVFGGSFSGTWESTSWFSPQAGRAVKDRYSNRRANGQPFDRRETEMVRYTPK
jgi:hypothetical protein